MSRSEERQRTKAEDFASLRNKKSKSRSRSRSRSRDRGVKKSIRKSPSPKPTQTQQSIPTTTIGANATNSHTQQQSMAAIIDTPLAQPQPSHVQYNIDETTLRKFCQPYNMEELVAMICSTAYVNREFYDILVSQMKESSKWCKLFVHGLPWTTTQQTLYNTFSKFGEIAECVILKDRNGQSKGYGFINYSNAQEAINAINAGPQHIDGRMVGSDLAWKGRKNRANNNNNNHSNKTMQIGLPSNAANIIGGPLAMRRLFVYSLLYSTTDETLFRVFSEYGPLEEAVIIKDKNNGNKSKGYGFVIFKNVSDAQSALAQPHKMIDGRTVHCSLAIDSNKSKGSAKAGNVNGLGMLHSANALGMPMGMAGLGMGAVYDTNPYQNVLYQQQMSGLGSLNSQLNNLNNVQSTQLLQQLLAQQIQQQQILQESQVPHSGKNKAPAPIHPSFQ